jgi:hypothetical protein
MMLTLNRSEMRNDLLPEVFATPGGFAGVHFHLQIAIHEFIGIQFRGVTWQKEPLQSVPHALRARLAPLCCDEPAGCPAPGKLCALENFR